MVLRLVGFTIVIETMEGAAAPQDLLCTIMMTVPLAMPFVQGILFGMRLVNLQETQVVCHQEHPCFERQHTMVGIVLEAIAVTPQDLRCAMMMTVPLVMPFVRGILFGMHLVNSLETQVVCHQEHPCFEGHTMGGIILEAITATPQDLFCAMMMTSPLVMPFVRGVLFGMHLVNLQETQVVCHQKYPCFEGHTMVGIVLEAMAAMPQILLCAMMMTSPLVMPFIRGVLFGMRLVNLQETQVVCRQEHPCFEGHTVLAIVLEAMAVVAEDLLCAMMMMVPLVMPFIRGVLFGMRLVNLLETQVVCHQEHPCFEGQHIMVGIILEAITATPQDLLCAMMMMVPLVMPFVQGILFRMRLVNSQETQVVFCQENPCFEGHTMVGIILEAIAATPQDLFCAMMMTSPLVMPFIWGILFGMCLVNSQETQVVCRQEHP
jgi:Sec-independent protein secretion pathway component TatC